MHWVLNYERMKEMSSRTGSSTVIRLTRKICRVVGVYRAADLPLRTTVQFAVAVNALIAACQAWEALDDQPGEIDAVAPLGSEDFAVGG